MLEHAGLDFQKALWEAVGPQLGKLRQLYYDGDLNDVLVDYLRLWDPSHHYYFHTAAANAVGAPTPKEGMSNRFDQRLFAAVGRLNQYLSMDPAVAKKAAQEANTVLPAVWKEIVEKGGSADRRRLYGPAADWQKLQQQAAELFNTLKSQQADAGMLTTFAVWSGYICTFTGNFEGPPTILSLMLDRYSKSEHFVKNLNGDTLLKAFVMIGVDRAERKKIYELLSKDKIGVARDLFKNGSWRSPSVYCVYSILGVAILIHHVDQLVDKYESGADLDPIEDDIAKQIAVIVQDLANLGLTGVTISYSVQLSRFLKENVNATASQLAARIHYLETATWRVVSVKCLHGTMASLGLGLSIWDAYDNWYKSDTMEKFLLAGTIASSFACVLGVLGVTSWLGPAGFVVGVVLGLLLIAYQSWFKSEMETTSMFP